MVKNLGNQMTSKHIQGSCAALSMRIRTIPYHTIKL